MKTKLIICAIAAAALASCSGKKAQETIPVAAEPAAAETVSYAGILPAADGAGIAYDLTLNSTGDQGTYSLIEQYNGQDTIIQITEGAYQILPDAKVQPNGQYYRLISNGEQPDTLYFVQATDSTLTMLTATLQPAPSGLDYTLTKK